MPTVRLKNLRATCTIASFVLAIFTTNLTALFKRVKLYIDTVNRKLLDSSDLLDLVRYDLLKKENLLYSPFIDLRLDNESIIKVYLTSAEYEKIKVFKHRDLIVTKKESTTYS